jgi:hypothetical protein
MLRISGRLLEASGLLIVVVALACAEAKGEGRQSAILAEVAVSEQLSSAWASSQYSALL